MAFAFDTLGYAKRLRESGVDQKQAEAHAEAVRDFVMAEIATKTDLIVTTEQLKAAMEHLALKLTVRIGVAAGASIAAIAAIVKLT